MGTDNSGNPSHIVLRIYNALISPLDIFLQITVNESLAEIVLFVYNRW